MLAGPQRIQQVFETASAERRAALLVNLPGNRDPQWIIDAARVVAAAGADMIEMQSHRPFPPDWALGTLRAVADTVDIPCILWTDIATVHSFMIADKHAYRLGPACIDAGVAGIAAAIPADYVQAFGEACDSELAAINFIAPGWPTEHFEQASRWSRGFEYAIGLETSPPTDPDIAHRLAEFIGRARDRSGLPVIVGAGVRTPEQAALAATTADGVAVATAVKEALEMARSRGEDGLAALDSLVRTLRAAVTHAEPA